MNKAILRFSDFEAHDLFIPSPGNEDTSRHSRNRNLGEAIGRGVPLADALARIGTVAEGVRTTRAARDLARTHHLEMPITEQVYRLLFESQEPQRAIRELMLRAPKAEVWG